MKIVGINLENLYSFEKLDSLDLNDMNLFVGKNNSGKSNLLKAIKFLLNEVIFGYSERSKDQNDNSLQALLDNLSEKPEELFFNQILENKINFHLDFKFSEKEMGILISSLPVVSENSGYIRTIFKANELNNIFRISGHLVYQGLSSRLLLSFTSALFPNCPNEKYKTLFNNESFFSFVAGEKDVLGRINFSAMQFMEKDYDEYSKDQKMELGYLIKNISKYIKENNSIQYIPAIRKINNVSLSELSSGGDVDNPVNILMSLRDGNRKKRDRYTKLKNFVHQLTFPNLSGKEFELLIPRKPENIFHIAIEERSKVLPLSSFGSGLEQLVLMAIEIVRYDDERLILLEEPEAHFHPELQRKFIQFLQDNFNNNQYFIASHSNTYINQIYASDKGKIFNVISEDCEENGTGSDSFKCFKSTISTVINPSDLFVSLELLGVKPSDILLANGIIWTEGISDKIYIEHWIKLYYDKHPEYKEKIPKNGYEILFYGGSVLSNFSFATSEEIEKDELLGFNNLVKAIKINSNAFVIMDKDNYSESGNNIGKEQTKERVVKEVGLGKYWITQNKEIEFYIPKDELKKIIRKNNHSKLIDGINKKDLAKRIVEKYNEYGDWFNDENDLEKQIEKLISVIGKWQK